MRPFKTVFIVNLPVLVFSLLFVQSIAATSGEENVLMAKQKRIEAQCEANFSPRGKSAKVIDRATVSNICKCVSENFLAISKKETNPANSARLLHYVEKYYAKELPKEQVERDPFYLDEFLMDIGNNCIKDPSYRHSYHE